ncbi:MAG: pyridoxamine 5'-phosphate oxidase family protein [Lachnospiraceae bacterium]|nr:pyridoxamine 5'-phosphate oxidase family protein [Lachnospiraceae bacterium]
MRRKDREVQNKTEVFNMLNRCDTIRIGMLGNQYPYVVPVSFGMEVVNGNAVIYFHCAQQGLKVDLLRATPNVCVEGDIFIQVEKTTHGITTRYESVIGFGKCQILTDVDEIKHGLKVLLSHYGYQEYPLDRCMGISHLLVGKIVLDKITGKKNLPGAMTSADQAAINHN